MKRKDSPLHATNPTRRKDSPFHAATPKGRFTLRRRF